MFKIFILEDDKLRGMRIEKFLRARLDGRVSTKIYRAFSFEDAVRIFAFENSFNLISLDHDLGRELTGYDVSEYIIENGIHFDECIIHSMNPSGAKRMLSVLSENESNSPIHSIPVIRMV